MEGNSRVVVQAEKEDTDVSTEFNAFLFTLA